MLYHYWSSTSYGFRTVALLFHEATKLGNIMRHTFLYMVPDCPPPNSLISPRSHVASFWSQAYSACRSAYKDGTQFRPTTKTRFRVATFPKEVRSHFFLLSIIPLLAAVDPLVNSTAQPGMLRPLTLACFAH